MIKYLIASVMLAHGLIHCIGFAKAYHYGNITQLTKDIPTINGLLWLLSAVLFTVSAILLLFNHENWPYTAIIAIVISQVLIITVWKDARFGSIPNILLLLFALVSWAGQHYERTFTTAVKTHMRGAGIPTNDLLKETDIAYLPVPLQKYIRYTGALNKPKVKNMKVVFEGEMREKGKEFFKFTSIQYNFFDDPARLFFMKANMFGCPVLAYHCYQHATATMEVKLCGLFTVVNVKGTVMNKAETVTLFNDMCLMAPASLIDKRIVWTEIDSLSAKAIFTNGINIIAATLYFNAAGQLINFVSDDRYVIGDMKQYRFSTPVKEYGQLNGNNIWKFGETIWHYPDGEFVYGKFTLKAIEYNLTAFTD